MPNRRQVLIRAGGAATLALPLLARAQAGTTRIVVGFAAGAGVDAIARKLADRLQAASGRTHIVENVAGAAGRLAASKVKHSAPDGRTLLVTPASTITVLPHLQSSPRYQPLEDFVPVTSLASILLGLIVSANTPARNLADYVQWVRRDPRHGTYASPGAGSIAHFLGVMFAKAAKLDLAHVPYKGAAPAQQDLVAGQVPAYAGIIGRAIIAEHRAGRVHILACANALRTPLLPEVPTFVESVFPGVLASEWTGVFAPAGTPAALVEQLNTMIRTAMQAPDMRKLLQDGAMEASSGPSADFAAQVKRELAAWEPVVRASGFKPDN